MLYGERERERERERSLENSNTYVNLIRLYRLILQMEDSTKYASNSYFQNLRQIDRI